MKFSFKLFISIQIKVFKFPFQQFVFIYQYNRFLEENQNQIYLEILIN